MANRLGAANRQGAARNLTVVAILIAVASLAIVIRTRTHTPLIVAISEVSGNQPNGDKVVVSAPEAEVKGRISENHAQWAVPSQVFACVGGSCNSAGNVRADGSWSISKVALRHPAENEREAQIQAILVDNTSRPETSSYVYSRTVSVTFPPPIIALERVCEQQITSDTVSLSDCKSIQLEGTARNLLWGNERVCVQIRTKTGKIYETSAPIDDSTADTRHWIVYQGMRGDGHFLNVKIGLDSVMSGAVCNTQSVLLERSFTVVNHQDQRSAATEVNHVLIQREWPSPQFGHPGGQIMN